MRVVVLPAPLGPRKPTRSPGSMSNVMPSTAFTSVVRPVEERAQRRGEAGRALVDPVVLLESLHVDGGGHVGGWPPD